jgi:transcriptional regulator with XRE-family HTH domain
MGGRRDRYKDIDANIAANVRAYREAADMSQEELAQQMADRGFPFTQATVWKVERGQRPVRAGELIALGDIFGRILVTDLTDHPDATRHTIKLERASANTSATYSTLKAAAAAYLDAQVQLVYAARLAHDAGHGVSELYTSWLDTPAEEAVIEARVEYATEDERREQLHGEVSKILDALRSNGYEPALRIEDIKIFGSEPEPGGTPAPPADTVGAGAKDPERQA